MKKGDFILIGLLVLIGLIAILSTKGTHAIDIEYPVTLYGSVGLHETDYNGYNVCWNCHLHGKQSRRHRLYPPH